MGIGQEQSSGAFNKDNREGEQYERHGKTLDVHSLLMHVLLLHCMQASIIQSLNKPFHYAITQSPENKVNNGVIFIREKQINKGYQTQNNDL